MAEKKDPVAGKAAADNTSDSIIPSPITPERWAEACRQVEEGEKMHDAWLEKKFKIYDENQKKLKEAEQGKIKPPEQG